jgi:hypothetical protein
VSAQRSAAVLLAGSSSISEQFYCVSPPWSSAVYRRSIADKLFLALHYHCLPLTGATMQWRRVIKTLLLLAMASLATAAGNSDNKNKTFVKVSDQHRSLI